MSHTRSGLAVIMPTKGLDASRALSSSSVWCSPWPGTPLEYWRVAKSDSDQMKASRLCDSPSSVIVSVMLHRYSLKRGLSFSDSSVSFATGYFTQISKTQSLLSSLNRTAIKKPFPKVISMCLPCHSQHPSVFPLWLCQGDPTFCWSISKSNSLSNKLKCWQYQGRHSEDLLFYFFMKMCHLF